MVCRVQFASKRGRSEESGVANVGLNEKKDTQLKSCACTVIHALDIRPPPSAIRNQG